MIKSHSNTLWLVIGPSGTGKDTLVNGLAGRLGDLHIAVSHTTRPIRPGEVNGRNYHYVTESEFRSMLERGEFLEHVEYAGNLYGVSRAEIEDNLETGDVIIIVEGHGARQLLGYYPKNTKVIFLFPPPLTELRTRMIARGDRPEAIEKRLDPAHIGRELHFRSLADIEVPPGSVEAMLEFALGRVRDMRQGAKVRAFEAALGYDVLRPEPIEINTNLPRIVNPYTESRRDRSH